MGSRTTLLFRCRSSVAAWPYLQRDEADHLAGPVVAMLPVQAVIL